MQCWQHYITRQAGQADVISGPTSELDEEHNTGLGIAADRDTVQVALDPSLVDEVLEGYRAKSTVGRGALRWPAAAERPMAICDASQRRPPPPPRPAPAPPPPAWKPP
jgi:hypothetical protein